MSTAHAGLALVSLALTAIYWDTSVANKLFTFAALEGNAGGYLVRLMSLKGTRGECLECQTPAWVNRDPWLDYVGPHWRSTATQPWSGRFSTTALLHETCQELGSSFLLPQLFCHYSPSHRNYRMLPTGSHHNWLGQLFWDSEIPPARLTQVHPIYRWTTLHQLLSKNIAALKI